MYEVAAHVPRLFVTHAATSCTSKQPARCFRCQLRYNRGCGCKIDKTNYRAGRYGDSRRGSPGLCRTGSARSPSACSAAGGHTPKRSQAKFPITSFARFWNVRVTTCRSRGWSHQTSDTGVRHWRHALQLLPQALRHNRSAIAVGLSGPNVPMCLQTIHTKGPGGGEEDENTPG